MATTIQAQDVHEVIHADTHGVEPIPAADRDSTGPQQMWIWAGANIAPINWTLGALGIVLGLGLWETIAIVVLGNLIGVGLFSAFTVMGYRTGVNQMVLSRSAFGRRGAYLPSLLAFVMIMGWIGVNTYFPVKIAVAILGRLGVPDTTLTNFIVVTAIMLIQVGIGVYGFYVISVFEKYTVPITAAIIVLMSLLAWTRPHVVNWGLTTQLSPGAHFASITGLVTAIGVGWGISWFTWASDYSRFVRPEVGARRVFGYSFIGMYLPTVWLAILGATIASVSQSTDPARMVSAVFGGTISILVLFAVLHGPIATNILNVYSSSLAGLSMGIRIPRMVLAVITGIVGYLVTLYFLYQPSFANSFDNWMVGLVLWLSAWGGVMLADYYIKRKGHIDVAALYDAPERSVYGDINWNAIIAFILALVGGWLFEYGLVAQLQGPISARLLNGADLSWLVGLVLGGGVYLLLENTRGTRRAGTPTPVSEPVATR